jgi:4-hydroxybenzoate polyprenyltransferase
MWKIYLGLGRVSNLPTVWSNVIAGAVLARAPLRIGSLALVSLACSAFYVGGMFLNDAFDHRIDARERPERPIPKGWISARRVYAIGFGLLAAGLATLGLHALWAALPPWPSLLCGVLLAGAIVLYDAWHKQNPLSPLLMGACRVLVYLTAGLALGGEPAASLLGGAAVLLSYLIGLTYVAKQENLSEMKNLWPLGFLAAPLLYAPISARSVFFSIVPLVAALAFVAWVAFAISLLRARLPGNIPRAVVSLIAGISLCDALLIATAGTPLAALIAASAFPTTLFFQRYVKGT